MMFVNEQIQKDAERMFIYFSELMDKYVIDSNGKFVGKIYDIIVEPSQVYPQSSLLIIRKGSLNHLYAAIKWADIVDIDRKEARLKIDDSKITFLEKRDNRQELTLRRDILDQQVVDTYNHKVIRVNDIHMLFVDHCLMVAHVDITTRGLVRRLGFQNIVDFFVSLVMKNSSYLKDHLISWKHIQPLSINPASMTIKVDVPHKQISSIPAADLGEIFLDLNINHQRALFKTLDIKDKAKIFTHIDFKAQKSIIEDMQDKEVVELLNNIPSDEATDFLEKLSRNKTDRILSLVETKYSKKLSQLLGYSSDSAGGLMTAEYIAFPKDTPIEAALKHIKERPFKAEPVQFVYIIDENNHLVGSTNFRRMMLAQPHEPIQTAVFPKTYFVHVDSTVKEIAYLMEKYKYYAIPVVDDNNILQGIVTVDDVLSQVISLAWRRLKRVKVLPKQ